MVPRHLWIRSTAAIDIAPAGPAVAGGIATSEEATEPLPAVLAGAGQERDTGIVSAIGGVIVSASGAGADPGG